MEEQFVMRKEFVTNEIAKRLKVLGFDLPTIAAFVPVLKVPGKLKFELFDTARKYGAAIDPDVILLPLWQQALDWFETKGIFISISYAAPDTNKFKYRIDDYNLKIYMDYSADWTQTRKHSTEEAILKALTQLESFTKEGK